MTGWKNTLLLWTLLLGACSRGISPTETIPASDPTQTPFPPAETNALTQVSPVPKIIVTVATPHIDQPPDGNFPTPPTSPQDCGYQWAYQDLPELSAQFDQALKSLNPQSASDAYAFGENCVGVDGKVIKFLAMETDFQVRLTVPDLSAHAAFGDWMAQVMQVVNSLPPDMLAGPNPGFVEFRFETSTSESIGFRVPIRQYNETANGKTGVELFNMFYTGS